MKQADTTLKLLKLDPLDKSIQKPATSLEIGMGAKLHIATYKQSSNFKESYLTNFYKGVVLFLSNLTAHMVEKCPLKHLIIRCSSCLSPNTLAISDRNDSTKAKFSKLLEKLTALNQISVKLADNAKEEFAKFIDEVVPENREKFSSFSKFDQRLDTFLSKYIPKKDYASLWEVCIIVFCLSHGQSPVERGFKTNKEFMVENQSENSLKSLRIINDHLESNDVNASTITITGNMMKSVKASRQRYEIFQEEKKKEQRKTGKDLKRKIITDEIEEVRKKKQHLQSSVDELVKDADELALVAEEKKDMKILERSNDLRKAARLKKVEIVECNEMEESLLLRRDSVTM